MKKPFREHHLIQLLYAYSEKKLPIDFFISQYFRENPALGSKDRGYIAETTYKIIRWQSLIDFAIGSPLSWEKRVAFAEEFIPENYQNDESIPEHIRVSFPENLFNLLVKHYGLEKAKDLALVSNTPAPTTIRVNTLKISREKLLSDWNQLYEVIPTTYSKDGLTFLKKMNFFTLPEFKEGKFEVQDEGSQLLADLVKPQKGQLILDFCSGSGGKTLAFAPKLENSGQIYLHDVRKHALVEAKKRLKRAGIQNAQIIASDSPHLKKLKKKMDVVLVDAPCTGTGTLRRNPDMKWRFEEEIVRKYVGQQRTIFEKALSFLKPGGKIVYATCSILPEENEQQLDFFIKTHQLKVDGTPFQSYPTLNGMDGFFGVVLKFEKN